MGQKGRIWSGNRQQSLYRWTNIGDSFCSVSNHWIKSKTGRLVAGLCSPGYPVLFCLEKNIEKESSEVYISNDSSNLSCPWDYTFLILFFVHLRERFQVLVVRTVLSLLLWSISFGFRWSQSFLLLFLSSFLFMCLL